MFTSLKQFLMQHRIKMRYKNFCAYKPVSLSIDKSSEIQINGSLTLNKIHSKQQKRKLSFLVLGKNSKLIVNGEFSFFSGCRVGVLDNATLTLGNNSYMNFDSKIYCYNNIKIGERVFISEGVTIIDSDVHRINNKIDISKPIVIEDNVWIGINTIILKGVTIGAGSVVSAGSVVTTNVPPKTLVGGVPAKIIKRDIKWE